MATRALTAPELALLRGGRNASRLYLAIRRPTTIYSAVLTAPLPSSTDMVGQISYTSGSGTRTDVKVGMTLYVGTTAGARDLGDCRIRKAPTSSIIYVGECSHVDWLHGGTIYLTIVDDPNLWAKQVKIVAQVPYMDFDVAYSNQHLYKKPIILMGSDVVLWRDLDFYGAGTVSHDFDASDSYDVDATYSISSVAWEFPGAASSSGSTTLTPTATYDADGQYQAYCTITLSNGASQTGTRTVFVFSKNNMPTTAFHLVGPVHGAFDDGGWRFTIEMDAQADTDLIADRTKVVLFARDFYGDVEQSIGGLPGSENVIATGWITGESIDWDPRGGLVTFTVAGAADWLKRCPSFPIGIELKTGAIAAAWTNMKLLTPMKFLWHIFTWRCTAAHILDIHLMSTSLLMQSLDCAQSSIWTMLTAVATDQMLVYPVIDRYNALYAYVHPNFTPTVDRGSFPTVMDLAKSDFHDSISITRHSTNSVSRVELSGVKIALGADPHSIFSLAPGHVFSPWGDPINQDYLLLASQAVANRLAGLVFTYHNRELDFDIRLPMNNRMFDIAPTGAYLGLLVNADDTPRGIAYDGKTFIKTIDLNYGDGGSCSTDIHVEQETFEGLAVNGDRPPVIPTPPYPGPPAPGPGPGPGPGPTPIPHPGAAGNAVVYTTGSGFWYTANWQDENPTWLQMNDGLDFAHYSTMSQLSISSSGKLLAYCSYDRRMYAIQSIGDAGGWAMVAGDPLSLCYAPVAGHNPFGGTESIVGCHLHPLYEDLVYGWVAADYDIFHSRIDTVFVGNTSSVSGTTNFFGGLDYRAKANGAHFRANLDGGYAGIVAFDPAYDVAGVALNAALFNGDPITFAATLVDYQSGVVSPNCLVVNQNAISRGNPPYITTDGGAGWSQLAPGTPTPYALNGNTEACAISGDEGQIVMIGSGSALGPNGLYKSYDGGTTFELDDTLTGKTPCVYYMGKDGASEIFVACQEGHVHVSYDGGDSWLEKTGDLATGAGSSFVVAMFRAI